MKKTLLLRENIGIERVADIMNKLGFKLDPETKSSDGMVWQIWMSHDEKSAIHYVDDEVGKTRYFSVRGKNQPTLVKALRKEVPLWKRDDILKHALDLLADGTETEIERVAMEVAGEMDEYDAASAGVLATFLEMDERRTRLVGARALRTRPHPLFHGTAQRLASDPDPEIAAIGRFLSARIEELHGG